MNVHVLIMTDRDIKPRCDVTTTAVFLTREAAMEAMEQDIESAVENEWTTEEEVARSVEDGYACTADGRLSWKIESKNIAVEAKANT